MADKETRTQTTTQIRNFYSDGMCYLNTKFYNVKLSFQFYPFLKKDETGKSSYDMNNSQTTTIDFEGAAALYDTINKIISGKITECNLVIPCNGASLELSRTLGAMGTYDTIFKIKKNNTEIPFKFKVDVITVKENGQPVTRNIESGLIAFNKTIEGYLTGINSDRHLDKLTDEFAALKNKENNQNNGNNGWKNNNQNGNYNNNRRPYNGNGGNRNYNNNRRYNNNYNGNNQQQQWTPPNQQNLSSYQIKN